MPTTFNGWGSSWGNSWGSGAVDPNAMVGATSFTLTAVATAVAALFASGSAQVSFSAIATLTAAASPVQPERRPKATSAVRFRQIKEGKVWATHSFAKTTGRSVIAAGKVHVPQVVYAPGAATVAKARHTTRCSSVVVQAGSRVGVYVSSVGTLYGMVFAKAGAKATVQQGAAVGTCYSSLKTTGKARSTVLTSTAVSTCERIRARGARNLSNYELAAVAVLIDRRR